MQHAEERDVLYFLDDDNTIDIRLLQEIRATSKVSMFPVGFVGQYGVSTPVLDDNYRVIAFYDSWPGGRKFAVDMAGFAVNVAYLRVKVRSQLLLLMTHTNHCVFADRYHTMCVLNRFSR